MLDKTHPKIEDIKLSRALYALGDEVRLEIARRLYVSESPLTCQKAVEGIENLPVSTRSHAFQMLRKGGIIQSVREGRECFNSIREDFSEKFPALLPSLFTL